MSKELSGLAESIAKLAGENGFRIILEPIQAVVEEPCKQPPKQASEPVGEPSKEAVKLSAEETVKRKKARKQAKKPESWIRVSECARLLKVAPNCIYRRIKVGQLPAQKDKNGCLVVNAELLAGLPNYSHSRVSIPVVCTNTGKEYKSIHDAAQKTGIDPVTLGKSLRTGAICKGLTFKRVDEPNP